MIATNFLYIILERRTVLFVAIDHLDPTPEAEWRRIFLFGNFEKWFFNKLQSGEGVIIYPPWNVSCWIWKPFQNMLRNHWKLSAGKQRNLHLHEKWYNDLSRLLGEWVLLVNTKYQQIPASVGNLGTWLLFCFNSWLMRFFLLS